MSRRTLAFVLALVACLATLPITAAQAAQKARKAPAGLKFYAPPSPLPAGKHGDVIWSRTITKGPVLKNAARTTLVLYRSNSLDGKAIAVSGTFAIPKGKAPKGGWPVISWAHGTTGSADVCAPSRDAAADPAHAYIAYAYPQFELWLKKGYALAFTDYEGLGTPGPHPYLVGHSEGRGVLDIVRAARKLDPSIGKRFAIAGHSQGGQSALFAAADAPKWTPELQLRGVASFAPLSQLTTIIAAASALTTPGGLSGEGALILDSMTRAAGLNVNDFGTPEALALLPQVQTKCLPQLGLKDSFGAIAPSQILRAGAPLATLNPTLDATNPALKIKAPILLLQGESDSTVFKVFTDQLNTQLGGLGDSVTYLPYPGVDHGGIVAAGEPKTTAWLKTRFK